MVYGIWLLWPGMWICGEEGRLWFSEEALAWQWAEDAGLTQYEVRPL